MKKVKFCPKCMNIIRKNDTHCLQCGMSVSEMVQDDNLSFIPKNLKNNTLNQENQGSKEEVKLSKREKRMLEEQKEINFEQAFLVNEEENLEENQDESTLTDDLNKRKRHKHKPKKKQEIPKFSVDKEGKYDIETNDVTFFDGQEEYSVRKARGDIKQEKFKWWEIYKWADLLLARRKIKKEVNKAARVRPEFVNKATMLILCALFGWMGAHNFYARNNTKGFVILGMWVVMILVVSIDALYKFMGVFVGGGFGFVVLFMWFFDFIAICFNRYRYRITKMQFIKKLNTETRAKLGKKYIDIK